MTQLECSHNQVIVQGERLRLCKERLFVGSDMAPFVAMVLAALVMCSATANAQKDCSAQFTAMQPCTAFVTDNTLTAPSKQCCSAFQATQLTSPACLCQLQQAFADPATAPGNATRANELPNLCAVAVNPSKCPALLGLAPAPAPTPTGADVDCSAEFDSLSSCIAYVTSNDTVPPADCCSSLLNVHLKRPVCLCQLLNQVNSDPSATSGLNVTKATELPTVCKTESDISRCPALLGAPVASPIGPVSAPVPEAGAPDVVVTTPVAAPDAPPVVTGPSGNAATSVRTPLATLATGFILHFLF